MLSLALTGILNFYALSGYGRIPKRSMNHPARHTINPTRKRELLHFVGGYCLDLVLCLRMGHLTHGGCQRNSGRYQPGPNNNMPTGI